MIDPIMTRFHGALTLRYGTRLERAVLFGSRARGDFRTDSDYDVAVFLRGYTTLWTELGPLTELATAILMDTGAVVSAKPFRAGSYRDDTPFMREIERDGVVL